MEIAMTPPPADNQELEALWRDPAHWRLGCLYYAPADPRVFVPKRGGEWRGQTLNWGRPGSWGIAAVSVLPVLLVAAFALWATR
jgi:uncharacterized membrane protein